MSDTSSHVVAKSARAISLSRSSRRRAAEQVPVLAVDDDPQALSHVRDAPAKSGYAPIVTTDPEEALRLEEEERPHLVLLDLMLPGVDGMELMKDITAATDVPVIFLSAYGQNQLVVRALYMGAADYLVKPYSPVEFSARISSGVRKNGFEVGVEAASPPDGSSFLAYSSSDRGSFTGLGYFRRFICRSW